MECMVFRAESITPLGFARSAIITVPPLGFARRTIAPSGRHQKKKNPTPPSGHPSSEGNKAVAPSGRNHNSPIGAESQ